MISTLFCVIGPLVSFPLVNFNCNQSASPVPSQVHLSVADNPLDIIVSWITLANSGETLVEYGIGSRPGGTPQEIEGSRLSFLSSRTSASTRYSHRVLLSNLEPNTLYWYRCGGPVNGWSKVFTFKSFPSGETWQPKVAIMGDMGTVHSQIIPLLERMTNKGEIDLVIHAGDLAYNMEDNAGHNGDKFFENIEPIAAHVPYMVSPGNHDSFSNFTNIKNRLAMPGIFDNFYYTFTMGPILFISILTELYYILERGTTNQVSAQYRWLEEILIQANQNREQHPWIVIYGHRPMYCNILFELDCILNNQPVRVGSKLLNTVGLETLLYKYGVDIAFWGHEHAYERMFPVYAEKVFNGSVENPYINPRATIHFVVGCGGNKEGQDTFRAHFPAWSAFHSNDYGFSLLTAENKTHLHIQFVHKQNDGQILDDVWVVQENHGSFQTMTT